MSKVAIIMLYGITFFELGYNAYLAQVGFYYNEIDKFVDATTSVKRVTDNVKENADKKFYRMASTFAYSRTSPSLLTYPGLENFSSTLEKSTIDHFYGEYRRLFFYNICKWDTINRRIVRY